MNKTFIYNAFKTECLIILFYIKAMVTLVLLEMKEGDKNYSP